MIHLGIRLDKHHIKAVALAGGFEPIGKVFCKSKDNHKFQSWIENLKWDLGENIIAFVDYFEFTQFKHYHNNIFFDGQLFYKIYLVHHRRLSKLISLLMGYNAYVLNSTTRVNKAFILACTFKIFSKKDLFLWNPEDDFPF